MMMMMMMIMMMMMMMLLNVPTTKCTQWTDLPGQFSRAATPEQKLHFKRVTAPNDNILTLGKPVPKTDPIMPGFWQGSHAVF